jgi:chromate transport protein ChrA
MVEKTTKYIIAAVMIIVGIILMSVGSSYIAKLKTKAEKDKSPWVSAVVIGVLMIVGGVIFAAVTGFGGSSDNAAAMVGTMPSNVGGSATAANAPQNPVAAIENAARAKKNLAEHTAKNAGAIENAAKELNGVLKSAN